jgi:predicted ATPase
VNAASKVVLTGGPHAGKTTLLRELGARGHRIVPEAAIEVIGELVREHGDAEARRWRLEHAEEFQARIAERQLALEREHAPEPGEICFYDRGVLDGLAYCRLHRREPPRELVEAIARAHYDLVVVCELVVPFRVRTDTGRTSDEDRARVVEGLVRTVYEQHAFEVVSLPLLKPVALRADRLLAEIAARVAS